MKTNVIQKRQEALREYLLKQSLDAALITTYENRRYFCGFTGSNGYLIITQNNSVLITDKRYTTQALEQASSCEIIEHGANRLQLIAQEINKNNIKNLVLESDMSIGEYFEIKKAIGEDINIKTEQEYFLQQRMVKDAEEVDCIRQALECAQKGFLQLVPMLKIGMTEKELADELHYLISKNGAEAMSFGTIVASGPRGAMAHGVPTDKVIENGDMVVLDFGVMKNGYCCDLTRTLLFGDVPQEHLEIFDMVAKSQKAAIDAIKPGVLAKTVEDAHRKVFLDNNMDGYALRGLGHGIGLQIHELPRVVIGNETVLKEGMVFTVEPGLYFPGEFGVRIEDDVLVTKNGVEVLSSLPQRIVVEK